MSTDNLTTDSFADILKRLMEINNFDREYQVANLFNISKEVLSQRKKRNKFPTKDLLNLCQRNGRNFNWITTGEGERFASYGEEPFLAQETNIILERLISALQSLGVVKWGRVKKVAEKTGYSEAQASAILSGKEPVNERFKKVVCRAYRVSETWIETGEGEMLTSVGEPPEHYGVTAVHRSLSPEDEKLLEILKSMPRAKEAMEAFLALPERKQKIHLGKMLESLEELEGEKKRQT